MKFKFNTIGSNKKGTKIYCKLSCNKHNILKGFYNFNIDKFIITKYMYDNFPKELSKNKIKKILKEILIIDYNWEL